MIIGRRLDILMHKGRAQRAVSKRPPLRSIPSVKNHSISPLLAGLPVGIQELLKYVCVVRGLPAQRFLDQLRQNRGI